MAARLIELDAKVLLSQAKSERKQTRRPPGVGWHDKFGA
jgi:hypothetical protein